jgi:hypothetical protein
MADNTYTIYTPLGAANVPLVLDYNATTNALVINDYSPNNDQTWTISEIPFTPFIFLRNVPTGLFAYFTGGQNDPIALGPLQPLNSAFAIQLQSCGNGLLAINNSSASLVFNVAGAVAADGTPVIAWPWGSGPANSQWMFAPPDVL